MAHLKKYAFFIFLTLLVIPQPHVRSELNPAVKTVLWCLGGTVVVGFIGTLIYNTFRTLSDSEELSRAQDLHDISEALYLSLSLRYEQDRECLQDLELSENELKYSIQRTNVRFPFLRYKSELDQSIWSAQRMINNISVKKNHLLKRKMQLTRITATETMSQEERTSYWQQYDMLIDRLTYQRETLQVLCIDLRRLERAIIGFPEYREELLLARLNKLEYTIDNHNYKIDYYPPHHYYYSHCYHDNCRKNSSSLVVHRYIDLSKQEPEPCLENYNWKYAHIDL